MMIERRYDWSNDEMVDPTIELNPIASRIHNAGAMPNHPLYNTPSPLLACAPGKINMTLLRRHVVHIKSKAGIREAKLAGLL